MRPKEEIQAAIDWFGETGNWKPDDCNICEDGSVWYGLTQLIGKKEGE
jgi:hypothetical protein